MFPTTTQSGTLQRPVSEKPVFAGAKKAGAASANPSAASTATIAGKDLVNIRFGNAAPVDPPKPTGKVQFDSQALMLVLSLKDAAHPEPAEKSWAIKLMKDLLMDREVQTYLKKNNFKPTDLFMGLDQKLGQSLPPKMVPRQRVLAVDNDYVTKNIIPRIVAWASQNGVEKINTVDVWRWVMSENPDGNLVAWLKYAEATDDNIERLMKPPEVAKASAEGKLPNAIPTKSELKALIDSVEQLSKKVVGQDQAVNSLVSQIIRARVDYKPQENPNPHKPSIIMLMLGPSGSGKSYTAKVLAKLTNRPLLVVRGTEYQDEMATTKITGSAPGYSKGDNFSDNLVEINVQQREKNLNPPVVMFDEIEKMHEKVVKSLMQVWDEGIITNGDGINGYMTGAIVLVTSNIAQKEIKEWQRAGLSDEEIDKNVWQILEASLAPEVIGRIKQAIPYRSLSEDDFREILRQHTELYVQAVQDEDNIKLNIDESLVKKIINESRGEDGMLGDTYGAREVEKKNEIFLRGPVSNKRLELIMADALQPGTMTASWDEKQKKVVVNFEPTKK